LCLGFYGIPDVADVAVADAALFTLYKGGAKRCQLGFLFFQQPQPGAMGSASLTHPTACCGLTVRWRCLWGWCESVAMMGGVDLLYIGA
jgi:hypothetical protein